MECKKFWSYVIDFYIYYAILFIGSSIVKNLIMYNGTINLFRMPLLIVWFILILINDLMLGNRSIGKHMMEIEVVDKDGNIPSAWKLIVRSLILGLLFPIEILSTLVFNKTIGDFILKTEVIDEVKEHKKKEEYYLFFLVERRKKLKTKISLKE